MPNIKVSSESVIGAALMSLGIRCLVFATADHSEEWKRDAAGEHFRRRFQSVFDGDRQNRKVVIAVDMSDRQYVVEDLQQLRRVWQAHQLNYCFTMTQEAFGKIRGDIAITSVPALESA